MDGSPDTSLQRDSQRRRRRRSEPFRVVQRAAGLLHTRKQVRRHQVLRKPRHTQGRKQSRTQKKFSYQYKFVLEVCMNQGLNSVRPLITLFMAVNSVRNEAEMRKVWRNLHPTLILAYHEDKSSNFFLHFVYINDGWTEMQKK